MGLILIIMLILSIALVLILDTMINSINTISKCTSLNDTSVLAKIDDQNERGCIIRNLPRVPTSFIKRENIIGHGGIRGSIVYQSQVAYKRFMEISNSELLLIQSLQLKPQNGLVHPMLVTMDANGELTGVVMSRLNFSMQEIILNYRPLTALSSARSNTTNSIDTDNNLNLDLDETSNQILRKKQIFKPVESLTVLGCIAYQLLLGLYNLKHNLPHCMYNQTYIGFCHNDIRLDNVLVDAENGTLLWCDFEHVGHYNGDGVITNHNRSNSQFNNNSRIIGDAYKPFPRALVNCTKTDEWALGLLLLELYTGVQPLLNADALRNDLRFDSSALEIGLDWLRPSPIDPINFPAIRDFIFENVKSLSESPLTLHEDLINQDETEHEKSAVSHAFQDFMGRILNRNTSERWNIEQLINHEWIQLTCCPCRSKRDSEHVITSHVYSYDIDHDCDKESNKYLGLSKLTVLHWLKKMI